MRTTIFLPANRNMTVTATSASMLMLLAAPGAGDPTWIADIAAGSTATVTAYGDGRMYAVDAQDAPTWTFAAPETPLTAATAASSAAAESLSEIADDGLADGVDIALGTSTGTKLGTAAAQKLGLWGVTPVIQPAGAGQAAITPTTTIFGSDTVDAAAALAAIQNLETLVNALRSAGVAAGTIKGAA